MQGSASTPAAPQQPRKSWKEWRAQQQHSYEAARQQALQRAPASVAAASAAAHSTLQQAPQAERAEQQQAQWWKQQQQLLAQQAQQAAAQQSQQYLEQLAQRAAVQQQILQEQTRQHAVQQEHQRLLVAFAQFVQEQQQQQHQLLHQQLRAITLQTALEQQQPKPKRKPKRKHPEAAAAEERKQPVWDTSPAAKQARKEARMERRMHALEANPQLRDPPPRRSYTKPPDPVDHPFVLFEQLPTNSASASPPAPLEPHPIAPAPDTSHLPAPERSKSLEGTAEERKQKLSDAKHDRACKPGGLSCGCDVAKLIEWVVLQLTLRGLLAGPEQQQSLLDVIHIKDEWKRLLNGETGMNRACRLTLEQIVAFIEAHQLVCGNHWRSNTAGKINCILASRKAHRYRRFLRSCGGCQCHTLPSFRGQRCPLNSTRPLLNLHHKTATCTKETWKLIEDSTCNEEEFHWYLHSGNLVCLCEVCHRITHHDKLIFQCKPCSLGCCSPSPEPPDAMRE